MPTIKDVWRQAKISLTLSKRKKQQYGKALVYTAAKTMFHVTIILTAFFISDLLKETLIPSPTNLEKFFFIIMFLLVALFMEGIIIIFRDAQRTSATSKRKTK